LTQIEGVFQGLPTPALESRPDRIASKKGSSQQRLWSIEVHQEEQHGSDDTGSRARRIGTHASRIHTIARVAG
jgi:hypothetical protein